MKRFRLGHFLKTSLWFVPLLCVLGAIGLSLATTAIDDGSLVPQSVTGDPTAAMQILYLIAFAMLTLTGLLLSLLVVAVQLAMGTFSPRIVRQILQDRPSQTAIGLFAGTFTYAMLAMRKIKTTPEGGTVPGLAVLIAIVLVIACIGTLVWYLNHITQSLRVAALVGWVADDTMATLDQVYPDKDRVELGPELIPTTSSGVVFEIDHDQLVRIARQSDCRFELLYGVGDFVPTEAALIRIIGDPDRVNRKQTLYAVAQGPERTLNQDVAYGIRMLVDIAERSLSSGPFEDPTTAVQAIDRIHDVLRQIMQRPLHSGHYRDEDGTLRLVVPTLQWDGFVQLGFEELRQAGKGSPQVSRRLKSALEELLSIAPEGRRAALEQQRSLLEAQSEAMTYSTDADRRSALVPDPSGIGSALEMTTAPELTTAPERTSPPASDDAGRL